MRINGHFLDVTWDVDNMPRYIGPFDTRDEAQQFARINVPNGTWVIHALAAPYARAGQPS